MCILIVEDDATLGRAFVMQLHKLGYIADLAISAKEALDKFGDRTYDLVLVDVGLPDIDGLELTSKLRQLTKERKDKLPIVGITAGYATREQCIRSGMDDFFQKPLMYTELKNVIEKFDPQNCKAC